MIATLFRIGAAAALLSLTACGGDPAPAPGPEAPAGPAIESDVGVDVAGQTISVGALNDESGPAVAIGVPFADGKRLVAARVNAGGSGLLPDGWTIELVEKDHGYNPQSSVQAFNEIKSEVLFFGTSFGTPNTLPLQPLLEAAGAVAFPASLSSQMAANPYTPPLGPSYEIEARRAMDWAVAEKGPKIKAGIVYQKDDYGNDGLAGWKAAAEMYGVELVAEQTIAPGQKDFAAVVTGLKDAGADVVLVTTLPSATGPLLGTAAQLGYAPTWIGNTPAWIDVFFKPEPVPHAVFANFYWVSGFPFWGEDVPGMSDFLAAYDAHGEGMRQDFYVLLSYIQGLVQVEIANRAIASGDITRAGYLSALQSLSGWDAGGLIQPIDLTGSPYVTGTRTRVLRPDFEAGTWSVVADYAEARDSVPGESGGPPAAKAKAIKAAPAIGPNGPGPGKGGKGGKAGKASRQ